MPSADRRMTLRRAETQARRRRVLLLRTGTGTSHRTKGNDVGADAQLVQVISPALHHRGACRQVRGAVVGAAVRVDHAVRQLVLDQVHALAQHFVHDGARRGPEAVRRHHFLGKAHAAQGRVDGVLGHAGVLGAQAGEDVLAQARYAAQLAQYLQRLRGQRHHVLRAHFHLGSRDAPRGAIEIEFAQLCSAQFTGMHKLARSTLTPAQPRYGLCRHRSHIQVAARCGRQ